MPEHISFQQHVLFFSHFYVILGNQIRLVFGILIFGWSLSPRLQIAVFFCVSSIPVWHVVATGILVEWISDWMSKWKKQSTLSFYFQHKSSCCCHDVKQHNMLVRESWYCMNRARVGFLSHLGGGLQQEAVPCAEKHSLCHFSDTNFDKHQSKTHAL